ncbi:MAG: hypothetical protein HC831_32270 [Chloroflexia bacterium]|nr:hypothetical protein [Chloroflexia bacterium]
MEESGLFLVVVSLECKYKAPARYDDVLRVQTRLRRMTPLMLAVWRDRSEVVDVLLDAGAKVDVPDGTELLQK